MIQTIPGLNNIVISLIILDLLFQKDFVLSYTYCILDKCVAGGNISVDGEIFVYVYSCLYVIFKKIYFCMSVLFYQVSLRERMNH